MRKTLVVVLACFAALCQGQTMVQSLDTALRNIQMQTMLLPQEKIYIQTDKPYYLSGEQIFFRAYLLDAFTQRPSGISRYVYVELINPSNTVVLRHKIIPEDSLYYGSLSIPEELPRGTYRIRAYTRFMTNMPEDYFYSKYVYIADAKEKNSTTEPDKKKIPTSRPDDKFEVSFYPEGGNLIAGQFSTVAFKALQSNGEPLDIEGFILDAKGNKITEFTTSHDGIGSFVLNPQPGEQYYAICRNGEQSIQTDLPPARNDIFGLKTFWRANQLYIMVNKPADLPWRKLYLLAHTKGHVEYLEEWDHSKEFIAVEKENFSSGVTHLLLLTEDFIPLSERLVFALNEQDEIKTDIEIPKKTYQKREKVDMNMLLKNKPGEDISGNFSISVTDDKDIVMDTTSHILSTILLTSEIRGHIPAPAYYFQKQNKKADLAADLLMMTHGWTRYDIPKAMRGDFQQVTVLNEESQTVSGRVEGGLLSKPYQGANVFLISLLYGFSEQTETDENGRFTFSGFEFPDKTSLTVQALTRKGGDLVDLYVDKEIYPPVFPAKYHPADIETPEFLEYTAKADLKYTYENGMRMIHLDELVVKGSRKKERKYQSPSHSDPDYTLSQEEIERTSPGDIRLLLMRLPGVSITGDKLSVRGGEPLIVIDGIKMFAPDDWKMVNAFDVAQIDVIKDPGKLIIYGAGHGVIEIFTKEGGGPSNKKKYNIENITPLGYHIPVEFYSPQYDTPETLQKSTPDLRSAIYWKPDVMVKSSKASISFYTADSPSTYSVIIEGVDAKGKLIYHRERGVISVE
ncbi:TonB-dependent receptor [Bacteroidia bacterium]|nr:TonB-dependent receptor [Bacteroidia bacterium]GHT46849.1 TonB-dependent receptor [Bacteroidia bacterium]